MRHVRRGCTWDDNGNLASDGVRSYTYDHANRLTQVTDSSITTQFAYNGDGVRISKTVDETTTQYVLDLAATLPVVISDTDAICLYGLDIIAQQQAERHYYMHDGLGSVRQLVDSTGQIATGYAYDPFGVPLAGGTVSNPYRFTGEAWDAEVQLLYLRARYYQPETGRFVTRDPWPGDLWRPGTLNGFAYVRNNPVSRIDRTGLQCEGPACPWRRPSPTPVPPVWVPTGSAGPTVTPGTPGPTLRPAPTLLPEPALETPSPCSVPTPPVPPPPAGSTWTASPRGTPARPWIYSPWEVRPAARGPFCPLEAPPVSSAKLYQLADWIDAVSSGAEQAGLPETVAMALTVIRIPPEIGLMIGQSIMVAPDAASAFLRWYADEWRECGY